MHQDRSPMLDGRVYATIAELHTDVRACVTLDELNTVWRSAVKSPVGRAHEASPCPVCDVTYLRIVAETSSRSRVGDRRRPGKSLLFNRLRLRRYDGQIYLDRWGVEHDRIGGVFLHRMSAPDPGEHLHNHPWSFWSLILKGGYVEERLAAVHAQRRAELAVTSDGLYRPGDRDRRRRWSVRGLRLRECHRIIELTAPTCWTLVVHGPRRRSWGFFTPDGWVHYVEYDETHRAQARDLWNEAG